MKIREGTVIEVWYEKQWHTAKVTKAISITGNEDEPLTDDDSGDVREIELLSGPYKGLRGVMESGLYIGAWGEMQGVRWRAPLGNALLQTEEAFRQFHNSLLYLKEGMYGYDVDYLAEKLIELAEEAKNDLVSVLEEKEVSGIFYLEKDENEKGEEGDGLSEVQ